MSAVTRIIYSFFIIPALVFLSACSDSGTESTLSTGSRAADIETPFLISEGGEGDLSKLEITFTSTVTGTISYSTFNVTAANKSDYISLAGELEVVEGEEYTVQIDVYGDNNIEGNELVGLLLELNGQELETLFGLIRNDDYPLVTIKTTTVLEGDAGTSLLRFTFVLTEEIVDSYSFLVTTPVVDTINNKPESGIFYAVPDQDFEAVNQSITFTQDKSEISIDVVVTSDNVIELDEFVRIQLDSSDNTKQSILSASGVIRTDDLVDLNGFDLSSVSDEANEGSPNLETPDDIRWNKVTYTIQVERPLKIIDEQIIQIKLLGKEDNNNEAGWASPGIEQDYCANNPEEFTALDVCETIGSYTLEPTTEEANVSFDVSFYVRGDLEVEESEEIEIQIQNDQGVVFGNFRHTITHDDVPSLVLTYQIGSGEVIEGNLLKLIETEGFAIEVPEPESGDNTNLKINLQLEYAVDTQFNAEYVFDRVRVSGIKAFDYAVVSNGGLSEGTLEFPAFGVQPQLLELNVSHDDEYEGREVLNLDIDGFGTIPIVIIDNDLPGIELTLPSGAVAPSVGYGVGFDFWQAIEVSEQEAVSASGEGTSVTHDFSLALSGGAQALDNLNVSYKVTDFFEDGSVFIDPDTTTLSSEFSCSYLLNENRLATLKNDESAPTDFDYRILVNDEELAAGANYTLLKGSSKLDFSIEVKDDIAVECLEFLSLSFHLSPEDQTSTLSTQSSKHFQIDNKDQALLKVSGFNINEQDIDISTAYALNFDQAIITSFTPVYSSNAYECNGTAVGSQDVVYATVGKTDLDGSETSKSLSVLIKGETLVEPLTETCTLSITPSTTELLAVQYCDTAGENCNSTGTATGVINDNDKLDFTITPIPSVTEPQDKDSDPLLVSMGTITWDKVIAENVGDITIGLAKADCAELGTNQDCTSDSDVQIASEIEIKNATSLLSVAIPATTNPIGIYALHDNIVENTEQLKVTIAQSEGSDYINSIATSFTSLIVNEDVLSVSFESLDAGALACSTSDFSEPATDCQLKYGIKLDKDLASTLSEMTATLSLANSNTSKVRAGDTVGTYDDVIIKDQDGNTIEFVNGAHTLTLIDSDGNPVENTLSITIKSDAVVEIDEVLALSLTNSHSTLTSDTRYAISDDSGSITRNIVNNDFINLVVAGAREEVPEPTVTTTPFTLSWAEDIDIANESDHPTLTYKISDTACTGTVLSECLSEHVGSQADTPTGDYVLAKDPETNESLSESIIRLNSTENSIDMDYIQLMPVDNQVELSEVLKLTLLTTAPLNTSPLIASITQDNGTDTDTDNESGTTVVDTSIVTTLNWDLTVNSAEKLQLTATSQLSYVDEYSTANRTCDNDGLNCTHTKSITSIQFTGSVADNGPDIELNLSNICASDTVNTTTCSLNSALNTANGSEQDYAFDHSNNKITVHKKGETFTGADQSVVLSISDDNWVENQELIILQVALGAGSAYIEEMDDGKGGTQAWAHTQNITINSDDTTSISLVRDTASSTCQFETNTTTFTEDDTKTGCTSQYTVTSSLAIAKEVDSLVAKLTRQGTTTGLFEFKADNADTVYDAIYTLNNTENYETSSAFSIPLHTTGTATPAANESNITITYDQDTRVEQDETLNYKLEQETISELFSVSNGEASYAINETIKNDDFIDLTIVGDNTQSEPTTINTNPYTFTWVNVLELPTGDLPKITMATGLTCTGALTLECLTSEDYTLTTTAAPLVNGTKKELIMEALALKPDTLIELPEMLNLKLTASSPYLASITHTGGVTGSTFNSDTKLHTLDWPLTVNSDDKLTVTRSDGALSSVTENCTAPCTATLANLSFTGDIPKNGPTIILNMNNTCALNTDITNYCAKEKSVADAGTPNFNKDSSEQDFIFNANYTSLNIHTYNKDAVLTSQAIKITLNNDDWVEVTENINLEYTTPTSTNYISSLPSKQDITLASEDITTVAISRMSDSSTCKFEAGKANATSFTENNCGTLNSQYGLTLTHSIAKEVATLQAALQIADTTSATFKVLEAGTTGFDLSAAVNTIFTTPDVNKKLYLPVHTTNTATAKGASASVVLTFKGDTDSEPDEQLNFSLVSHTSSALYSVPIGANVLAFNETILNDDSVNFWLTVPDNQEAAEKNTDSASNTALSYTLNWDRAIPANTELTFEFKLLDGDTAILDDDYKIKKVAGSKLEINGTTLVFSSGDSEVTTGTETFVFEIIGDTTVELPEAIQATLAIKSGTTTDQIASINSGNNKPVNITIPNDDRLNITLYSDGTVPEGSLTPLTATQPFSYSIDKNIAANVPTIELYMDADTCVSSDIINCAEYNVPNATNDYLFGDVASNQIMVLHKNSVYTPKSAIDSGTQLIIPTPVPMSISVDTRVEAHESLIIEFSKGNDAGAANTNVSGRQFVETLLDGNLAGPQPVNSVNELSMISLIQNDDKINLFITDIGGACVLENEESTACDFELSWFAANTDTSAAVTETNTAKDSLASVISHAETEDAAADTAAGKLGLQSIRWENESEIIDAKDKADKALSNAQAAKGLANTAVTGAGNAITAADSALLAAETSSSTEAAVNAKNAALAAKAAADEALAATIAAENAANSALDAIVAATKAKSDRGWDDDSSSRWTKYYAAVAAANAASAAAESATSKANSVITTANNTTQLAETAIAESLQTALIIDTDAGEISLDMTLSGTAKNVRTPVSTDEALEDPQDYIIELEDESGGAVTEQANSKIIIKNKNVAVAALPRTLTLSVNNDSFMEPAEDISIVISPIAISDAHEYIAEYAGVDYTTTIVASDKATITVSQPSEINSNEGNTSNSVVEYGVTLTGLIAKNVPDISLSAPLETAVNGKFGEVTAADSTDYSISSLKVHEKGKETLSFDSTLDLTINSDNTLELDELVKLNLAVSGGTLAGIDEINYTIENDDVLTINVVSDTSALEGSTAEGITPLATSTNAITYTLLGSNIADGKTETLVAANYPTINVSHTIGGAATLNKDFIPYANFNIHTISTPQNNGVSIEKNLKIVSDNIVEKDESVILTFADDATIADDVVFKVNSAAGNILTYGITNNDFIHIDVQCGDANTSCDGSLTESGTSEDITVFINSNYETQGLAASDLNISFASAATQPIKNPASTPEDNPGSGFDYSLQIVALPLQGDTSNRNSFNNGTDNKILTVASDGAIELQESFNITLPTNSYVSTTYTNTAFTIISEDVFTVNPLTTQLISLQSDPTDNDPDGTQTYNLQVCRPSADATQGGALELITTLNQVTNDIGDAIETVSHLRCADIDLTGTGSSCEEGNNGAIAQITSPLTADEVLLIPQCSAAAPSTNFNEIPLFTLKAQEHAHANKWFEITDVTADERCAAGSCVATSDSVDVVLFNNLLSNVLDTGLTQCLKDGLEGRWAVDCATLDFDYVKQDAAQTDRETSANLYPDLAYTYVGTSGLPMAAEPGIGDKVCVQDNNTGFIWSGTILDSANSDANTRVYTELAGIADHADYGCELTNGTATWQLPTVQDLMSIMDVEKLKTSREFGFRFTNKSKENVDGVPQFYKTITSEESARYWTSIACDANHYYTLNFLNGELACEPKTATHSIITVYK